MNNILGEEEETIEDVTVTQDLIETEETIEDIEFKKKVKKEPEEPEEKISFKLNDSHVKKHDEGVFELMLPKPKTKVRWMKDGVPILDDEKFKIDVYIFIK